MHALVVAHVAHWKLSGRTCTPLEPSESMQTLELGYVNAGFLVFAALILLTLLLGRFFCGWACHVVAYQDLCAWLLEKLRLRPRPVRARVLKLVPLGAALYMFAWPAFQRAWSGGSMPPLTMRLTTTSFWRTFPGPWMAALTILVDGALIVWWLGAKGFCTYGCPYGALFGLADRLAVSRIRVNDSCEGCGHCTAVCTSNVRVHEEVATFGMVVDPGCMKCLDCVNSCPKHALYFGVGKPSPLARAARDRIASDLTWTEELLAAAIFLVGVYAFHGLYDKVPFLLALGLSALAAIAGVALLRLVSRSDFELQWTKWRAGGRFTRTGALGLAALALFLGFVAHSFVVQLEGQRGERWLQRWLHDASDATAARESDAHLSRAAALGLFPDDKIEYLLAVRFGAAGDANRALEHMQRSLDVEHTATRYVGLATLLLELGRRDEARAALQRALELEPANPEALHWLAQIDPPR